MNEPPSAAAAEVHVSQEPPKHGPVEVGVRPELSAEEAARQPWNAPNVIPIGGVLPSTPSERTEACICHIGGALTSFLLPMIQLLINKNRSPYVAHHAREALNFQISAILYVFATLPLLWTGLGVAFVLGGDFWLLITITLVWGLLWIAVCVPLTVLEIVAAVAAYRGRQYYYPLTVRLVC
jgi:uncharacterized Tic20 family protein